jgi:hypothetical protein
MEGPSLRKVFANGLNMFEEISVYIAAEYKVENVDGQLVVPVSNNEIETYCFNHGRMALLLDGLFSKFMVARGEVTDSFIDDLEKDLKLTMLEWERMGMSATPKWHIMLDHGPGQLKQTEGFSDMLEDWIERGHQQRARDESRLSRLRNQEMMKKSQAKFENARSMASVQSIQLKVAESRKRNLQRETSLVVERNEIKKAKRNELRLDAAESATTQDMEAKILKPKAFMKLELKKGGKAMITE